MIHPTALVESEVGEGTVVWAFAHILAGAHVGSDCKIGDHVFIEGGAVVGDRVTLKNGVMVWWGVTLESDVFVGPGVVFTNDLKPRAHQPSDPAGWDTTIVRSGASIGANATIVAGIELGENSMVGAGSVVTKDIPDFGLAVGNPARHVGWVCRCGSEIIAPFECSCGESYEVDRHGRLIVS